MFAGSSSVSCCLHFPQFFPPLLCLNMMDHMGNRLGMKQTDKSTRADMDKTTERTDRTATEPSMAQTTSKRAPTTMGKKRTESMDIRLEKKPDNEYGWNFQYGEKGHC